MARPAGIRPCTDAGTSTLFISKAVEQTLITPYLQSRTAARKELLDQATAPDECEKLYEESLWCLYALQDDLLQTGNPFMEEDKETIATWIKRTKLRLVRCRARMAMSDRDRMNDARADQNLADVARIPAPWDTKPST